MRTPIYWASFFVTLHYALLLYINSSFLEKFFSEQQTSLIYTASAIITLCTLSVIPHLINRYRRYWVTLTLLVITAIAAFAMSISTNKFLLGGLFLAINTTAIVLRLLLDIYLEQFSRNADTGAVRGIELTVINIAIAISPFLAAYILAGEHYERLYLVAALVLIPGIATVYTFLREVPHHQFDERNVRKALSHIWQVTSLRTMFLANLLLEFFYAWMVIYMPVYLTRTIGFSWAEIGIIFSIMLLPFVFFELPLGAIADRTESESEILTLGFVIMALFTGSLVFLHSNNIYIWALILFMTRVGAAAVEIMSESHFFRNISVDDANLVGTFRDTRPLAFIAAPLLGSVIIGSFGYNGIFLGLAALMLWGVRYGLAIKK